MQGPNAGRLLVQLRYTTRTIFAGRNYVPATYLFGDVLTSVRRPDHEGTFIALDSYNIPKEIAGNPINVHLQELRKW